MQFYSVMEEIKIRSSGWKMCGNEDAEIIKESVPVPQRQASYYLFLLFVCYLWNLYRFICYLHIQRNDESNKKPPGAQDGEGSGGRVGKGNRGGD